MASVSDKHTLLCRTLFSFTEAAKHELIGKFRKSVSVQDVDIEPGAGNFFVLRCPKEDTSSVLTFWALMRSYITSEVEKKPEVFEELKVKRIPYTQLEVDPALAAGLEPQKYNQNATLIPYGPVSRTWQSNVSNSRIKLEPRAIETIAKLCGCDLENIDGGRAVMIKGESSQEVDKASSKLDAVIHWADWVSHSPHSFDFAYTGDLNTVVAMKTLRELGGRRLPTTLINLDPVTNKRLGLFLTVIDRNLIDTPAPIIVPLSSLPSEPCLLWTEHSFKARGDLNKTDVLQPQNLMPALSALNADQGRSSHGSLDHWVEQSAAAQENPFDPPASKGDHGSSTHGAGKATPNTEPAATHGAGKATPNTEPAAIAPPVRKRYAKGRKPVGVTPKEEPAQPLGGSSQEALGDRTSDVNSRLGSENANEAVTENLLEPTVNQPQHMTPPTIAPPYMPAIPAPLILEEDMWSHQFNGRVSTLINTVAAVGGRVEERVQPVNEAETRNLETTMAQRKAPPESDQSRVQLLDLLERLETITTTILTVARCSPGPTKMRMHIGRLLLDPRSGSKEYQTSNFPIEAFYRAFPNKIEQFGNKLESLFTRMLTTSAFDAQFILRLKNSSGENMFNESPIERKVTYNFDCIFAKTGDKLIVKVDEEGGFEVVLNELQVGAFNWHFPKRLWDAQLTINASEQLPNDVRRAVEEMADTLFIRPSADRTNVALSTRVKSGDLKILSISLHRETSHRSSEYHDIHLHLLEVQELILTQNTPSSGTYQATLRNPFPNGNTGCKFWWEVSLSSKPVDRILEMTSPRELGDEASWTAQEIMETNAVKDLTYVTRDVVEMIDIVGLLNKVPKSGTMRASEIGQSTNSTIFEGSVRASGPVGATLYGGSLRGPPTTVFGGSVRARPSVEPGHTYW